MTIRHYRARHARRYAVGGVVQVTAAGVAPSPQPIVLQCGETLVIDGIYQVVGGRYVPHQVHVAIDLVEAPSH
jgi:hypothetical protein